MRKKTLLVGMALSFCLFAEGAYPEVYLGANSDATKGFSGATWLDSNGDQVDIADFSKYNFVVKDSRYFDLPSSESVDANKITLGIVGEGKEKKGDFRCTYDSDFRNVKEGVELKNGKIYSNYAKRTISGNFIVLSPNGAPFSITAKARNDYIGGGVVFAGAFSGADDVGVHFNAPNAGCVFGLDDASEYYGDIVLTATNGAKVCDAVLTVSKLSAGNVAVSNRCTLAFTSSSEAEVGNICLSDGAGLKFVLPETVNSTPLLTVKGNLDHAGKVSLSIDSSLIDTPVNAKNAYPLMVAPAVAVDPNAFKIDTDFSSEPKNRPKLSVTIDESGSTVTVYAVFSPVVTMQDSRDDSDLYADSSSSMTNAAPWSDKSIVHKGAHYEVQRMGSLTTPIRTPWYPEGCFEFLGESLTLGYRCHLILACREFMCPLLVITAENNINVAAASDVDYIGDIEIRGTNGKATINVFEGRTFKLIGELKGGKDLVLNSGNADNDSKIGRRGNFELVQDSEGFSGKVLLSSCSPQGNLGWSATEPYAHVWYNSPKCFGGPLDAFVYDALTIEKMARLITTNKVEFADQTRGLFLSGIAQLETPAVGDSLTLLQPVTVNGCVYKQGLGALAMGGELKFLDAEGNRSDIPPEDAENRTLYVEGGRIKPLSADAFNGLSIVFSNTVTKMDVALEIDLEPNNVDLGKFGLRNDKTDTPLLLALNGGAESLPVRLCGDKDIGAEPYSVGIMTVKSSIADEVFSKLKIIKPAEMDCHMTRSVIPGETVSTLSVTLKHYGTTVVIR